MLKEVAIIPRQAADNGASLALDLGTLSPKQQQAVKAFWTHKFTCYGGA